MGPGPRVQGPGSQVILCPKGHVVPGPNYSWSWGPMSQRVLFFSGSQVPRSIDPRSWVPCYGVLGSHVLGSWFPCSNVPWSWVQCPMGPGSSDPWSWDPGVLGSWGPMSLGPGSQVLGPKSWVNMFHKHPRTKTSGHRSWVPGPKNPRSRVPGSWGQVLGQHCPGSQVPGSHVPGMPRVLWGSQVLNL